MSGGHFELEDTIKCYNITLTVAWKTRFGQLQQQKSDPYDAN